VARYAETQCYDGTKKEIPYGGGGYGGTLRSMHLSARQHEKATDLAEALAKFFRGKPLSKKNERLLLKALTSPDTVVPFDWSNRQIATAYGISMATFQRWRDRKGFPGWENPRSVIRFMIAHSERPPETRPPDQIAVSLRLGPQNEDDGGVDRWREIQCKARAEIMRAKADSFLDRIVEKEAVVEFYQELFGVVFQAFERRVPKVAAEVSGMDPRKACTHLAKSREETLTNLQGYDWKCGEPGRPTFER